VIVGEEFVSAEDGSGVVHMAPAFGADDYAAGRRHGLAFVQPVDARGRFDAAVPVVGGEFVKAADAAIVDELRARDVLWKAQKFVHSYPHCWRCGTPLLYYARSSWFVRTTAYKDAMLGRNGRVDWHPEEVGSGALRRVAGEQHRLGGVARPVLGHAAAGVGQRRRPRRAPGRGLVRRARPAVGPRVGADFDPHKPFIDDYTWPAPSGTGTMRRVPEVIDTWFDSGSMPFAQWHYPFEHQDVVARQYPADYIAEASTRRAAGSTRCSRSRRGSATRCRTTASAAPYRSVVVNDLVLDAEGRKMSKSKGNVVSPWDVMERHGADAARLFLVSASQVSIPRRFDEAALRQSAGNFLVTLRNVYAFFAQYANFGWAPSADDPAPGARPALDRWVLGRLSAAERDADALLAAYDPTAAARRVMEFFDADVSKWYVRLSRPRFWFEGRRAARRRARRARHAARGARRDGAAARAVRAVLSDWLHRASPVASRTGRAAPARTSATGSPSPPDPPSTPRSRGVRRLANLGRAAREAVGINAASRSASWCGRAGARRRGGGDGDGARAARARPLLARS
jgi:isoleucyl-tRNA synthetase